MKIIIKGICLNKIIVISLSLILLIFQTVSASVTKHNKFISFSDVGQGQPLILIHAFPTDMNLWLPQQNELKKYFRVITLDLWGFGQSEVVDGKAVTMTKYADEVKQLMNQLHIHKAIIGGESMGGYIALSFLKKYPDSIDGLILSDTQSIADSDEMKIKREAAAVDVMEHGTAQFIQNFMPKALSPNVSSETKQFLQALLEKQSKFAFASALRGMALREDTSNVLSDSQIPILIISGEKDILISPDQSKKMHLLAKNSKLIIIDNAGHLSSLEQPTAWNRAVIEMFKK